MQQFAMLLVMPQLVGLMLTVTSLRIRRAWPVVLLSLFPPCTPIVMCLRMSAMAVPAWQLGALAGVDGGLDLGAVVGRFADLSRRHPDVRQARDIAGDAALAAV